MTSPIVAAAVARYAATLSDAADVDILASEAASSADRTLLVLRTCDSTNDEARRVAEAGAPHGTGVLAWQQRAGRGRRGRVWRSPRGTLPLSLVLRPMQGGAVGQRVPSLMALAVLDVAESLGVPLLIKWPNDLVRIAPPDAAPHPRLGSLRKVCGMLAEAMWSGGQLDALVFGLGLNIWSPPGGYGPLENEAAALFDSEAVAIAAAAGAGWGHVAGEPPFAQMSAEAVRVVVAQKTAERALAWWPASTDSFAFAQALARIKQHCALLGKRMWVEGEPEPIIVHDLADDGGLIVRRASGTLKTIHAGDVFWSRPSVFPPTP